MSKNLASVQLVGTVTVTPYLQKAEKLKYNVQVFPSFFWLAPGALTALTNFVVNLGKAVYSDLLKIPQTDAVIAKSR